jgi:hypothetical protein
VYVTLNPIRPELLGRCANTVAVLKAGQAATDADVTHRHWMLIDLDPVRPARVSATDAEKAEALKRMREVRTFFDQLSRLGEVSTGTLGGVTLGS